jgi:hypothetical protein
MKGVSRRGNKWWIRYRFNGMLIRQPIGDQRLAEETNKTVRCRMEQGQHEIKLKEERRTLKEMMVEYLEKKSGKRSLQRDRVSFMHIGPFFGEKFVHTITPDEVKRYRDWRKAAGKSSATCNRDLTC